MSKWFEITYELIVGDGIVIPKGTPCELVMEHPEGIFWCEFYGGTPKQFVCSMDPNQMKEINKDEGMILRMPPVKH